MADEPKPLTDELERDRHCMNCDHLGVDHVDGRCTRCDCEVLPIGEGEGS